MSFQNGHVPIRIQLSFFFLFKSFLKEVVPFCFLPYFLSFVYSGRAEISFTVSPAYGNMTETAVTKVDRRWVSARCCP